MGCLFWPGAGGLYAGRQRNTVQGFALAKWRRPYPVPQSAGATRQSPLKGDCGK
ncbi:hypothetical protein KCP75_01550 [Salmonella enterica subsp. enterica]|nr:hypothetical protein KCP75_01550 [Salmonella enterica subsp. enterica]